LIYAKLGETLPKVLYKNKVWIFKYIARNFGTVIVSSS
jgi:hypothetical protein